MSVSVKQGIERGIALVASLLRASLIAAVAVMLACIAIQVVMRYVFGRTPSWSEEVAVLMFSWATLGGLALGVHEGFHVRLDFLVSKTPDSLRPWFERLLEGLVAAFGAYLAWSGQRFLDMTSGAVSAAIGYPIEILHGFAPAAGALIFLFALRRAVCAPGSRPASELAA